MSRLDQLLAFLKDEPNDSFLRYGLAMEYAKLEKFDDALREFNTLLAANPDYVAAYFMAGRTCEQNADPTQAKSYYKKGIEVATRTGDSHAASEISAALFALE